MSCQMPSRGSTIWFAVADGSKTLRDLLQEAAEKAAARRAKLDALLEVGGGSLQLKALLNEGHIHSICLAHPMLGSRQGEEALQAVRSLLDDKPGRGFVEVIDVGRDGFEKDLEASGRARLRKPLPIQALIRGAELRENGSVAVEKLPSAQAMEMMAAGRELSPEELAMVLTDLIVFSTIVDTGRELEPLIEEALERSRQEQGDAFYRLSVDLRDGSTLDAFFSGGRFCRLLIRSPGGLEARVIPGGLATLRSLARQRGVERARLYRVECPRCRSTLLGPCAQARPREEAGPASEERRERAPPEREEARRGEEKRRRRGLLGRLFGRR